MMSRAASSQRLEPLRHVEAGVLKIAYFEAGPADGPVVLLLHGFPTTFTPTSIWRRCWPKGVAA